MIVGRAQEVACSQVMVQKTTNDSVMPAEGVHGLRAGRLRVGQEQRTRVMVSFGTHLEEDRWYVMNLISFGIGQDKQPRVEKGGCLTERDFHIFRERFLPRGHPFYSYNVQ